MRKILVVLTALVLTACFGSAPMSPRGLEPELDAALDQAIDETFSKHDVNPCTANSGDCYSIQGQSPDAHCQGVAAQHPMYVEADGKEFFLECVLWSGVGGWVSLGGPADNEDSEIDSTNRNAKTQQVWVIQLPESLAFQAKVPLLNDAQILACYRHKAEQTLQCFIRNTHTSQVKIIKLHSDTTGT